MEIWKSDEKTGLKCGVNDFGDLFLGDSKSGYNLPDTPENRGYILTDYAYIMSDYDRYAPAK